MVDGHKWNWFMLANIVMRASLHPVMKRFGEEQSCLAPIPLRYGYHEPGQVHLEWIDAAKKILIDAEAAILMGICSNRLDLMLMMATGRMGVLLTTLSLYCGVYQNEAQASLDEIDCHLAERVKWN
jgi:hypothetical protein